MPGNMVSVGPYTLLTDITNVEVFPGALQIGEPVEVVVSLEGGAVLHIAFLVRLVVGPFHVGA